jgi:DNA-binding GntR family transcriptional regulator
MSVLDDTESVLRSPRTLSEQAYDLVEELIVTLRLRPGMVFSEAALAELTGMGRTPLREALQRLAAERLIHVMPRRGMIVAEIDLVDFLALLETRRALDRLVLAAATRRASAIERDRLLRVSQAMERAAREGAVDAFMRADREGDDLLAAAAHNPYAVRASAPLHTHCRRFWMKYRDAGDVSRSAMLHGIMLRAVADRDEAGALRASDLLVDYLEQITRETLELRQGR